jgi:hypothetical protein
MQTFSDGPSCVSRHIAIVRRASSLPSLDRRIDRAQNSRSLFHISGAAPTLVINPVHRFEESIAGRRYLIEVAPVSADRWRACIVRLPGVPTALMPFYGETPDEAARHLTNWLSRAHQRAGSTTG